MDIEKLNKIGIITIDAPPLNISTREVKDEIRQAAIELENDDEIAVIIITGEVVGAQEARQIGLVNRVAEKSSALEESIKLAESIARYSLAAIQRIKQVVKRGLHLDFTKANQQAIIDSKEAFSTHDANEGINAFLEKRAARFTDK